MDEEKRTESFHEHLLGVLGGGMTELYGIYSCSESDRPGGVMFWSNEHGWGGYREAARFTKEETGTFNLPMSAGNDAAWFKF